MTKASRGRVVRRKAPQFKAISARKWQDHGLGLALVAFHEISQQLGGNNRDHLVMIARVLYGDELANSLERRLRRLPDMSPEARKLMVQYGYLEQDGKLVYVGNEPTAGTEDDEPEG